MKILLISANQSLQNKLHRELSRHKLTVDLVNDTEAAWELLRAFIYDLVLLEIALPKRDGLDLCRRLRSVGNSVLILLLVEAAESDTAIQGLDNGADAFLAKPIQEAQLLAQIRALARRGVRRANPILSWGPLQLDPTSCQVVCHGERLPINRKEYQILELFLNHPRQMFPRSEIGDRLWSLDEQLPSDATIKTHIRSLRRKLEQAGVDDLIQTHYNQGYCLNPAYDPGTRSINGISTPSKPAMDTITANLWQELMTANARLHEELEQRRQIEERLRRSESMLRIAQQVAQIGCWEFDIRTRQNYWTEELYLIHGLDPSSSVPNENEVLDLIHPDDLQIHEEFIRAFAFRKEVFEANLRIIRANDGEVRYINARGGPILDSSGKVIKLTGTVFDVTRWVKNGTFPDTSSLLHLEEPKSDRNSR